MNISPELEKEYDANRLRMMKVNRDFHTYMWLGIILGAILFGTSFFIAAASINKKQDDGPWIFYNTMSTGIIQILLGIGTIVLSWLTAMKKRVPCLILLGIYFITFIMILINKNGTLSSANIVFMLLGLALNIWIQHAFNEHDELKQQKGYPLFSIQADYRAHYEVPAHVRARQAQASSDMDVLGQPTSQPAIQPAEEPVQRTPSAFDPSPNLFSDPRPVKLPPEVKLSAASENALGITDMTTSTGLTQATPAPDILLAPTDVSLDSLDTAMPQAREAILPQVNPTDLLVDMTAIPSHATTKGNPDMLPTPEDVRARMDAMKRAMDEHHPAGTIL